MTFRLNRRAFTCVLLMAALGTVAGPAAAQDWPAKPVRMVVPFAPGGVTDLVSRIMAQGLSTELGQPVVVENRAGASGITGADITAKADADGYTIMMGNISTLAINAAVFAQLPYDPQKSFQAVSMVARQPLVVAVNPNVPANSLQELVELARSKPGELNFGSAGASLQLAVESFNQAADIKMTHVPYKGSGPAMTDLVAGHVQVLFDAFSSLYPFIKEGRMRGLAITSAERSALAPELPTLAELGFPNIEVTSWQGIVVPAGTPPAVVTRLNEAINKVLASPETREQLVARGVEASPSTPDEMSAFAAKEMQRWKDVAKKAGIKPE